MYLDTELTFSIYGQAPVQAYGALYGYEFYFRARGSGWVFVLSFTETQRADVLQPGDECGYFWGEQGEGYVLWGRVDGGEFAASFLTDAQTEELIRMCAGKVTEWMQANSAGGGKHT